MSGSRLLQFVRIRFQAAQAVGRRKSGPAVEQQLQLSSALAGLSGTVVYASTVPVLAQDCELRVSSCTGL